MTSVVTDIIMVAMYNDMTTNFLVMMVILVTRVTNVTNENQAQTSNLQVFLWLPLLPWLNKDTNVSLLL